MTTQRNIVWRKNKIINSFWGLCLLQIVECDPKIDIDITPVNGTAAHELRNV